MKKLLLPIVLLILGIGGGVGAGIFLAPAEDHSEDMLPDMAMANPCGPDASLASEDGMVEPEPFQELDGEKDYARLNNQFVVPVVSGEALSGLVVLSLSVEIPVGQEEMVFAKEPKLRDAFLQVLFEHANIGGFDGNYTAPANLRSLREALRAAAIDSIGPDATDVLILELVRRDV